jgi:type II secretory pathway pseudopilin PulG
MVAVVIIAIVAVIAIWLVRRRRRAGKRALELQVAVIGFEASGKTVYISSMFNELRVPDASGVFLDTSPENAGKLLALYNTTADPDKKFPDSTNKGEVIEWPFTVKAKSPGAVVEVGKFSYLDFAGESLRDLYTNQINPETQRLYDRFRNADVLMATLDGQQVKRYMENRPWPGFQDDLGTLLALLSNHEKAVNLILTKWDILEDHYTFRQVVTRLFQISQFANFVRAQQLVGVCRLIPVSSVGPGFAQEVGESMRKVPGKVINPERVDLPIACSLPGALIAAKQRPQLPGRNKLLAFASLMKLNFGVIQIDLGALGQRTVPAAVMAATNTPTAVGQLVRYCDGKLNRLDAEFPESDLVRFMYQQGM